MRYLIAVAILLFSIPAQAEHQLPTQSVCAQRLAILEQLENRFKQVPTALGLANNGMMVELISSPDGKTWTIILTRPNGISCLVSSGKYWTEQESIVPGEDS